jgi:hypothetical protein
VNEVRWDVGLGPKFPVSFGSRDFLYPKVFFKKKLLHISQSLAKRSTLSGMCLYSHKFIFVGYVVFYSTLTIAHSKCSSPPLLEKKS